MLRIANDYAQEAASGVGWVSLGLGFALTLAPRKSAAFLGWGDREQLACVIGVSDLVVGMGLLVDRSRSRWMLARALLNVVIALNYASVLVSEIPERKRATGGLGLMTCLTFVDYSLSRRLREAEAARSSR